MIARTIPLAILLCAPALAQTVVSADDLSNGMAPLGGTWQLRLGDDPRWATSAWDEPGWTAVTRARSVCGDRAYRPCSFWVRLRVQLPARIPRKLSFTLGPLASASEVFVNGKALNPYESLGPSHAISPLMEVHSVPPEFLLPGSTLLIAARAVNYDTGAYVAPNRLRGPNALIGNRSRIEDARSAGTLRLIQYRWPLYLMGWTWLVSGLYILYVAASNRWSAEYYWAAVYFLLLFIEAARYAMLQHSSWLSYRADLIFFASVYMAVAASFQRLSFSILTRRLPWSSRALEWALILWWCVWLPVGFTGHEAWIPIGARKAIFVILMCGGTVLPSIAVTRDAWCGSRIARLFFFGISGFAIFYSAPILPHLFQWLIPGLPPFPQEFRIGRVGFRLFDLAGLQFLITMFVLLTRRQAQTMRERERLSTEFEAARELQSSLVPAVSFAGDHFRAESVYAPAEAEEVGGDFFQVLPANDGTLLVIAGDVSGKGLKAAMVVAIIAGLIREIVTETRYPAAIMEKLNAGMLGQTGSGFVTCICALLRPNGRVTIVSAGHLPPYLNGSETFVESSLPLGLAANAKYEETSLQMGSGDTLFFLSDGVVEARSKAGELYGFDRVRDLLAERPDVEAIARAARSFGQEDDITAISIQRERCTV